jgi:hypothetical protein
LIADRNIATATVTANCRNNSPEMPGVFLHHPLDVLDHDDRIVDHDADGEHQRQQRHRVGRVADHLECNECADQADRHGERRYQRRSHAAEEEKDHDHHQHECLDQRLLHLFDRRRDEAGRVVSDLPGEILGEALLELPDAVADGLQGGDRVGARRLVDRHRRRRPPVQPGLAVEIGGPQLDARDIAQAQHRSVGIGAHDDILELGNAGEPPLGLHVELQLLVVGYRPGADATDGGLDVLRPDGIDDVAGGEPQPGQAIGPHPGPHGVVLRAPKRRISHA